MSDALQPEENNGGVVAYAYSHRLWAFALGLISAGFLGVASIAAIVLAYLKRSDAAGTLYASHFDWVIRTFWWGLLWLVLSAIATWIFIGWLTGLVAIVWVVYRIAKGWLALLSGVAPSPEL